MQLPHRIPINLIDSENEKLRYEVPPLSFIELHETFFVYHSDYYSDELQDEDDKSLGYHENRRTFLNLVAWRSCIQNVTLSWLSKYKRWRVNISLSSGDADWNNVWVFFKIQSKAEDLRDTLLEYVFGIKNK